jgi:hypothetical protein
MWSHYADQHRGFLLAFNARHPFFDQRRSSDDEFHHIRKVRYADERPTTTAIGLLGPHTLLTKSAEWTYEQEWRMLVEFERFPHRVLPAAADVHLVQLPRSCIVGVVLGCRMARDRAEAIADVLAGDRRYAHVDVRQASLDPKKFGLVFREFGEHYLERGKELAARAEEFRRIGMADLDAARTQRLAEEAVADLDCAIRRAPCADAYLARGTAHAVLAQQEEAAADFKRAWIMDPSILVRTMLRSDPSMQDLLPAPESVAPAPPRPVPKPPARSRPWETAEDLVGRVVRYWNGAGAAGVDVLSTIRIGDVLHVSGSRTDFVQQARSIERKHLPVTEAREGTRVGLKVDRPVCEGDEVYRVRMPDLRREREAALWIRPEPRDTFAGIVQRRGRNGEAVVQLLAGRLAQGDHIRIRGRNTDARHEVDGMRAGGRLVTRVDGTALVRLSVPGNVRAGDLVYRVRRNRTR